MRRGCGWPTALLLLLLACAAATADASLDRRNGEMENKTRKYASLKQISALIDFMIENKDIANNRVTSAQGRLDFEGAWDRLMIKLNAMGGGAIKSTDKWKQTWRDLKSNTKKKVCKNRQNVSQTGGGPSQEIPLTDLEVKVIGVLGADAVVGMDEVQEVEVQEINHEQTHNIPLVEKKNSENISQQLPPPIVTQPQYVAATAIPPSIESQHMLTITPTSWAERRQAQRQKKKRGLVCQSLDIRNTPDQLNKLRGCTVVEGQLRIVLMERTNHTHFENVSFPELREITGYLVLYRVRGLRTLGDLFPNLSVIRGNQLFKDYALVIYDMESLLNLGLRSLTHILRGSVRIEHNDRLCYVDTVDWAAIAPQGTTNIVRSNYDTRLCPLCPGEGSGGSRQSSCPVDFDGRPLCWDDKHCQKQCPRECREGACMDNGTCCHESCVGGCSSPKAQDCFVCRHFTFGYGSNRKCLEKCPAHTYQHFGRRCVTETECRSMPPPIYIDTMNVNAERPDTRVNRTYKTLNDTCVYDCPAGYEEIGEDDRNTTCLKCPPEGCTRPCLPGKVESLDSAELFRGCTHIQGSLEINIRGGGIVMSELESCLGEVREIDGALKVTRSYALVSLGFFKKLRKIGGQTPNGTKKQSLFIFDNPNLEQLWNWDTHGPIEITEGKLFIHFNPKLCFSEILPLKNMTKDPASIFDELEVSKENNGDKAACFRETLHLNVSQLDKNYVLLSWSQYCLDDARKLLGYSIYFTKAENNITQYERRDACSDTWSVDDMSMDEVQNNSTFSSVFTNDCNGMQPLFHPLTRLSPYTRYAAYVKTYTTLQENRGAQSPIIYFTTLPGQPSPPMFSQQSHVDSHTVVLKWARPVLPNGSLIMYQVLVQRDNHHEEQILQLNYCGNPSVFATFIAQRKDESPKKKSDKEMYAGQVRDDTCRCDSPARPTTRFTPDREAEQLEAIEFENQLQNQIYVRSKSKPTYPTTTTTKTRRSIDNQISFMLSEIKNSTQPNHNEIVPKNITDEAGFVDVYFVEVNANTTSIKLENLRHYSWYTVTLRACREKHPKESQYEYDTFHCSEKTSKTIMTWERADADIVTNVRAELLPANKSLPEVNVTWDPPKQPNGIVVAYNIRHSRVENDNPKAALQSCLTRDDYVSNGHAFILRNLAPGNYSIAVSAVTLRGAGNFSVEAYINVPERSDYSTNWIWGLIVGCVLLLGILAVGIWYARRGFLPPTEANKLFASVNPEYVSTVYVPDEWEVARTSIELVRELGQGTFGMVYEGIARNIVKGTPETRCAVKTVNEHATDRERIEFLNEASVMKAFDTFHVVRLLGVVSRGQPTLVVMELMEQGDLKSYLRSHRPDGDSPHSQKHPPTLQQIQQMAIEIADGMAYLSAKKFVHRDLAARNCMVAGDLTVKVGDFGMTRDIYETDYYRKGTKGLLPVRWMSPESLKDGVFSSNSDVWSYGVVLWEMATLAMQPYQGLSNEQVLRYVTEGGVMERPEQCPDRLYELMRACWAHRPSARPSFLHLVASLAPSAAPHFRQRSFFHTPHGQELYAQQQNMQEEEPEGAEVNVGAVATGSGSNLFGVSGRLASWVRELSSLRSRTSDDAAAEPLAPSPPEARAILLKGSTGPNGVLSHERWPDRDLERYSCEQPATSGC